MRAITILAAAALMLSACQSAEEKRAAETGEIDVTNRPTADVRKLIKAAAPKTAAQQGMWKAELKLANLELGPDVPGGPDAYKQSLKRLERSAISCRKADDLKPFDIAALEKAAGNCTFLKYAAKSGKIDAQLQCQKPGAALTRVAIRGNTSSTAFDVTTRQQTGKPGEPGYVAVELRATGTRIGDCAG